MDYAGGVDSGLAYGQGYATRRASFLIAIIKYDAHGLLVYTVQSERTQPRGAHEATAGDGLHRRQKTCSSWTTPSSAATQLHETVDFLARNGAKSVHMQVRPRRRCLRLQVLEFLAFQ